MKAIYKALYNNSPIWFQNFMISIYGYKIFKQRYGKSYKQWLSYYKNKDYSNREDEIKNQNLELETFINFVSENSPYYKSLYEKIDISTIKTVEDLKQLPIVDKEMLRQNIDKVYTIKENEGIVSFTGGTTGKALKVIFNKSDFQKRMAYLDAFKQRLGIDTFKVKKATFSGRELTVKTNSKIFWRYNYMYNQKLYSTFDLTEENMPFYVADLNKFKPEVLNGFVSALYELAGFISRNRLSLEFKPKAIFTTSETLLPIHRELIERIFSSKIYNQYASAEGAPFVTECKNGDLHYNIDTGVIETTGEDNNQMLVTSFTTTGTPLIRYNIGDLITFKEGKCNCGSSHPLVEKIEGRKVDFLQSKIKGKISLSHLADVIKGNPNSIKKMQFIQEDLNYIIILIVIDKKLFVQEHEEVIMNEMKYRFGDEVKIEIRKVVDIPREKSGKFSLIKNNIKK